MKDGYSICFNEWALDKDIKNELGLLLIISSLCADKGYCYATNTFLGELFNIPEQTVSRKLKILEEKKYITIEYKKRGCEIINRYIRLTKMLIHDYQKCEPTINKNVKENNISINNTNINNNIYEQEFERLWVIYPKKQGKKDALKHFIKARKQGIDFDIILKGVENYNEYIKKKKITQQYIKQGSTWFNQNCWEDDYTVKDEGITPSWFGKEIKEERLSEDEQREIDRLFEEISK